MNALAIILIVIGAIIGAVTLASWFYKAHKDYTIRRSYYREVNLNASPKELILANLSAAGITDYKVVEGGYVSRISYRRKKIVLGRRMRRTTVYSVAKAMQFCAVAINMAQDEHARSKAFWANAFNWFGSLFLFGSLIFAVIACLVASISAVVGLVVFAIAVVVYALSVVVCIKVGNIYKNASVRAMELVKNTGVFEEEDVKKINALYKMEIVEYKFKTAISVLYVVWFFLQLLGAILKVAVKRK